MSEKLIPMPPIFIEKEGIELTKNTRGYGWRIKLTEINMDRLEELNNQMVEKFENNYKEVQYD